MKEACMSIEVTSVVNLREHVGTPVVLWLFSTHVLSVYGPNAFPEFEDV